MLIITVQCFITCNVMICPVDEYCSWLFLFMSTPETVLTLLIMSSKTDPTAAYYCGNCIKLYEVPCHCSADQDNIMFLVQDLWNKTVIIVNYLHLDFVWDKLQTFLYRTGDNHWSNYSTLRDWIQIKTSQNIIKTTIKLWCCAIWLHRRVASHVQLRMKN